MSVTQGTGWLIDDGRMCLGFCVNKLRWVTYTDPTALRLARAEDAERLISHLQVRASAVEHLWG